SAAASASSPHATMSIPGSMSTPCGCACGTSDSCACAVELNENRTASNSFIGSPDRVVCYDELRAVGKRRTSALHASCRAKGCGLTSSYRDRMRLLDRTAGRTIRDICVRELERPLAIVAAARVELRGMVSECEQMPAQKLFEAKPCGLKLY